MIAPSVMCKGNKCMAWQEAKRNQPEDGQEYGQCIHHLSKQATMDIGMYLGAMFKQESRVVH